VLAVELAVELTAEPGVVVEVAVCPPGKVVEEVVGVPGETVVVWLEFPLEAVPDMTPLPKLTFWACSVPVQSTPLEVVGLTVVSIRRASMRTYRVWVSRRWTRSSTAATSFSVATTTNWLERTSGRTLLRLSVKAACALAIMLEGLANLS